MNPFEIARIKANDARIVFSKQGIDDSTKGYELVERVCKQLDLAILKLPLGNPQLNGADAVIRIEKKRIAVRRDLDNSDKAFLIAHELGHYFLHQTNGKTFEVNVGDLHPSVEDGAAVQYVESYGPRERQELQANVFARELLLPRELGKRLFLDRQMTASRIANELELPLEVVRLQLMDGLMLPTLSTVYASAIPKAPTQDQLLAVNSPHKYTLVEAGPGTGKTTTLLLRVRKLLSEGVIPTRVVILTFSNKAAGELVARLKASDIPDAERMWVGTFHSFGLEFLRKFGTLCGLTTKIHLIDRLGAMNLVDEVLPDLSLNHYDVLTDSLEWLPEILDAITRCKDDLTTSAAYRAEIVASPSSDDELQSKRLDAATIFEAYEAQLKANRFVDFNDLLGLTSNLLNSDASSVEEFLMSIKHVLVDEYQDVNRASAQLVRLLSKQADTVWAVGDANQAIYAFMGASSRNLDEFEKDFPDASRIPLGANHRSYKEITDSFHKLSRHSPSGTPAKLLHSEKGASGETPCLVECSGDDDELDALAQRIFDLETDVPYGQQVVLVNSNDMAAVVSKGLEQRGVSVLFLGNIYERPEIKELLRLMLLSVDVAGGALGSDWMTPAFKIPYKDLVSIRAASGESPWWECDLSLLTPQGKAALTTLNELTKAVRNMVSPWEGLCHLLLEDAWLTAKLCADPSQSAINTRLSVWQFVHSCRASDGLNRFPTIRNFRAKIIREIRLKLDKNLRNVPPDADGLNAVRVLTMHKSKGLEFDAVHLVETKRQKHEARSRPQWPLIPDELITRFIGQSELAASSLQAHNLLYVAMSRARKYLAVYKRVDEEMPPSMDGICTLIEVKRSNSTDTTQETVQREFRLAEISVDDLKYYKNGCPRRVELSHRMGHVPVGPPGVFQLIRIVQSRVVKGLVAGPEARTESAIGQAIQTELRATELLGHGSQDRIVAKLTKVAKAIGGLYDKGGTFNQQKNLRLGEATINVLANQVVVAEGLQKLRILRNSTSSSDKSGQVFGVLMKSHKEATGEQLHLNGILVEDGSEIANVKNPQARTIDAYIAAAEAMKNGYFKATPSPWICPTCPYYMYCDQGQE